MRPLDAGLGLPKSSQAPKNAWYIDDLLYDRNMVYSPCVLQYEDRSEVRMSEVTVSPKFQIVIPRAIREALGIRPGQKVQVMRYGDRIELIPLRPIGEMRGFLRGIDTSIPRDGDRV